MKDLSESVLKELEKRCEEFVVDAPLSEECAERLEVALKREQSRIDKTDDEVYKALASKRATLANRNINVFLVYLNDVLMRIAKERPVNLEEMGVIMEGKAPYSSNSEVYWEQFLSCI